jgi:maleylpyruvate isomerase
MLAEIVNSGIQPLQNTSTLKALSALGQDSMAWSQGWIDRGLRALDEAAAPTAGRFLVGDAVSFADIALVPQLYNARRFNVDVAPFARLLAAEAACLELPAFQAAHPDRQPDAEPAAAPAAAR